MMRDLVKALLEAEAHVVRQQFYGKHEQDRIDAVEWIAKWKPMMKKLRHQERPVQRHEGERG